MTDLKRLQIRGVLNRDAEALIRAREEAGSLHQTGDIRAAGNQLELQVRSILKRRLPARYRVAHGHALDYRGFVSPQVDVILADAINSPSIFEANDGTEYVPFEAVYALGEVKSTYYKSKNELEKAIETVRAIRTGIWRAPTERNPFFYFVFYVASGKLDLEDVAELYRNVAIEDLPNLVCWLDRGTMVYTEFGLNGLGQPIPRNYCLSPATDADRTANNRWMLFQMGRERTNLRRKPRRLYCAAFRAYAKLQTSNSQP